QLGAAQPTEDKPTGKMGDPAADAQQREAEIQAARETEQSANRDPNYEATGSHALPEQKPPQSDEDFTRDRMKSTLAYAEYQDKRDNPDITLSGDVGIGGGGGGGTLQSLQSSSQNGGVSLDFSGGAEFAGDTGLSDVPGSWGG